MPQQSMLPTTERSQIRQRSRNSVDRLKYKTDPRERLQDIPNCPVIDDLFNKKQEENNAEQLSSLYDADDSDNSLDPYEDLDRENKVMTTSEGQDQSKPTRPIRSRSDTEVSYHSAKQQDGELMSMPSADTARLIRRASVHGSGGTMSIERELRIVLVNRRSRSRERHRNGFDCGRNSISNITPLSVQSGEADGLGSQRSGSNSMADIEVEDDFDCCMQLWEILVKSFLLLIRFFNFVLDYKILLYPMAFFLGYLFLGMLHSIMASLMASLTGWIWPPTHFFLSTTAGFIWRMADWLMWIDELGRSLVCDMAASYCRRYRLLCDRQCSFVDRAMEHGHGRRCF